MGGEGCVVLRCARRVIDRSRCRGGWGHPKTHVHSYFASAVFWVFYQGDYHTEQPRVGGVNEYVLGASCAHLVCDRVGVY